MPYHVLFQGAVYPDHLELTGKFYGTLLPLLHKSPGFISETPFASTTDPYSSLEFATFADADAVNTWRVQKTHLAIERSGREKVFSGYRIRVGPGIGGSEEKGGNGHGKGQVVVIYQRHNSGSASEEVHPENGKDLVDLKKMDSVVWSSLNDEAKYRSESSTLWLSAWSDAAAASHFESAIERVVGDSVQKLLVARDYGKDNRSQAPGNENEMVEAAE